MSEAISTVNIAQQVVTENVSPLVQDTTKVPVVEAAKVDTSMEKQVKELQQKQEVNKEVQKVEEQQAIEEVASKLQDFVNLIDKKLQFSVDENSGRHIVTVTDKLSGDIIRQIPSEEVLRLAQNLSDLAETATRSGKLLTTEV